MQKNKKKIIKEKDNSVKTEFQVKKVNVFGICALLLIVFGFIITPLISGLFNNTDISDLKFGYYKEYPIYYEKDNKFAKYVNHYTNLYSKFQGQDNTKNVNIDYNIWYLSFIRYSEDIAFLDLIKKYSFYISKESLNKNLLNFPEYLDSRGNFNLKKYNKTSEHQKIKIYDDIVESILISNMKILLSSSLILPDSLLNFVKNMSNVERNISYITLSYQDFPNEEIILYAKKNFDLFKRLNLAFINFKNKNDAKNAYEKLKNKTPFEELAKLYSDRMANSKVVVPSEKYYFDLDINIERKEDVNLIFDLKENEFTGPIKSKYKNEYQIYKAFGNVHHFDKNLEYDINSVRNYIETYEPNVIESYLENKLNNILFDIKSNGLNQALKKYEINLKKEIVNLTYNMDIYPSTLNELSQFNNSKSFFEIIFGLKKNNWSKPFIANKKIYSFFLNSYKNRSQKSEKKIKSDKFIDSLYIANNSLITNFLLNKKNFINNFNDVFFSLQNENSKFKSE